MTDPYRILGVLVDAGEEQIKAAYRRLAKETHPDSGGDLDLFMQAQRAYELLLDPVRRKVFDATGYDPEFADPMDLQGALIIETLVNDIVLDDREAGSFDPLARMRAKLAGEIHKARFHIREMEGHKARIGEHIERLNRRPETDVLGFMLKARIEAITRTINDTRKKIDASERAYDLLEAYSYTVDPPRDAPPPLKPAAMPEPAESKD